MILKISVTLLFTFMLIAPSCSSQERVPYKKIDTTTLFIDVYYPKTSKVEKNRSAMVFFYGGGWKGGSIKQFEPHAKYFSERGMVCILVDYRVKTRHNTTPFDALKDAKSAIRFVRGNADRFNIDSSKIIAVGGSAGGHLAAASSIVNEYSQDSDDLSVSCIPNALVLFNPVIDNGPGGYGYERIGDRYKEFSPLHNITKGTPPTIMFLGTKDRLIPVETVQYYKMVMEKVGSRCELKIYDEQGHGFFNYNNFPYYKKTVLETDKFLQSLGYLKISSNLKIE